MKDYRAGFIRASGLLSPRIQARLDWRQQAGLAEGLVETYVRQGHTVLDIGASWGLFTDRLSRLVGPEGCVHAFEPNPLSAQSLRRLRRRNVLVYEVALSDRNGRGELCVPFDHKRPVNGLGSLERTSPVAARIHSVNLARGDDLLPSDLVVHFVKCDVEGHELAVLRGLERLLRRCRPPLLVEIEQRHQRTPIGRTFTYLVELGYLGYAVRRERLDPIVNFDVRRDQIDLLGARSPGAPAQGYVVDFLFLPAPGAVQSAVCV
jgi:FkbM family methyltransferase